MQQLGDFLDERDRRHSPDIYAKIDAQNADGSYFVRRQDNDELVRATASNLGVRYKPGTVVICVNPGASGLNRNTGLTIIGFPGLALKNASGAPKMADTFSYSGVAITKVDPDPVAIIAEPWTIRTSAADNGWHAVTFGNGLFVAVSYTGIGNRVMTSPDGITWTIRTSAADNEWLAVTFGNGIFVAVSHTGIGNQVMTSPDGITWTIRSTPVANSWSGVTFGNGIFVAVAHLGTGNRVMTSPDGITWTLRTPAQVNGWSGVTFGNGIFVAVSLTGIGNRVMTSPDGITWTIRTSAADNDWRGVTFGNGLFVAVSDTGIGNRVMTQGRKTKTVDVHGAGFTDSTAVSYSTASLTNAVAPVVTPTKITLSVLVEPGILPGIYDLIIGGHILPIFQVSSQ